MFAREEAANISQTEKLFIQLFENSPSKIVSVIVTVILVVFLTFGNFGIIWYEKFGSDKKRTLINKLFASVCWWEKFKPSCHVQCEHAFSALWCVFEMLILVWSTNVSTYKMQHNLENTGINRLCKLAFS